MRERELFGRYAVTLNAGVNSIYVSRTSLDVAFDDNGGQTAPLTIRLTGNIAGLMKLFKHCGWQAAPDCTLPHQFTLMAIRGE